MPACVDVIVPVRRLSPAREHFFFGYYDVPAADAAGRHLCHCVAFRDRLPVPGDRAILGWLPLPDSAAAREDGADTFRAFAETEAWNFQQGSMLQWLASPPNTCIYNLFEEGRWGSCLHDICAGVRRRLPLPVANVARDGRKALCINMARLYDFRPGYGYEEIADPWKDVAAPEDDGVFLMDLATGAARLILSLAEAVRLLEKAGENIGGHKVVINHITFNPSATRFLFLLRTFPEKEGAAWQTWLLTAGAEGGDVRVHPVGGLASHYHWRDDDGMLFYARGAPGERPELVLISDATGSRTFLDRDFFRSDGHCSYSPDRRWLLYDGYPDRSTPDRLRSLQLYDLERRRGITLGRFRSEDSGQRLVDLRCDLHPRWMPDGLSLSFDSIHEGYRGLYAADLRRIVAGR
jgi:hypothetical protein